MLKQTDARGNVTTIETDLAERTIRTTDAQGNITTITYFSCCDAPACIKNALGNTTCYSYDIRGRKTAEYGTAIQPACFAYDDNDHMIALTTFRADEGDITTDPSNRTDGDTTTWLYDTATGLELKKTYADGSCVSKTYDRLNRLETFTKARGIVTTYDYAPFTGELLSVSHSDNTHPWFYSYNHLGQMTSISDISGIRELTYDAYGRIIQDISFGQAESCLHEEYDAFGRSRGYRLILGTRTVQHSYLDYDQNGVIIGMNMEGLDTSFTWEYDETSGFLNQLSYPNGMVRKNIYHPKLNLIDAIGYEASEDGGTVSGHDYQYNGLMHPVQCRDFWDAATPITTRKFVYNPRGELVNDQFQAGGSITYQYDNIGNRKTARELEEGISYGANQLNQYTDIIKTGTSFQPSYDADGNQTRIKTSTGIWDVCYDANDRPISFISEDGRRVVICNYDTQGRRFEKKVIVNGVTSIHTYYLYRGYLQIAQLDMMHPEPVLVKSYVWDPTESTTTRLLMMTCWKENSTEVKDHFYFMHDVLKNVSSIFDEWQTRRARYEYAPFGELLTTEGDIVQDSRFRFSCEYSDDEIGLIYYNYRHFNPEDGRWINRDPIQEQGEINLYRFINNATPVYIDYLGLFDWNPFQPKKRIFTITETETKIQQTFSLICTPGSTQTLESIKSSLGADSVGFTYTEAQTLFGEIDYTSSLSITKTSSSTVLLSLTQATWKCTEDTSISLSRIENLGAPQPPTWGAGVAFTVEDAKIQFESKYSKNTLTGTVNISTLCTGGWKCMIGAEIQKNPTGNTYKATLNVEYGNFYGGLSIPLNKGGKSGVGASIGGVWKW